MGAFDVTAVLRRLELTPDRIEAIRENHGAEGNANWHVWPRVGERRVLRRYYDGTTVADLTYEHATLEHLARQGWCVPVPLSAPVEHLGRWYCLTRWVPGTARRDESAGQQRQRGADLARLHLALRSFPHRAGQRPGWRRLDDGIPVMTPIDWRRGLSALASAQPELAEWAEVVVATVATELAEIGATDLPSTLIHGDFLAGENVHYDGDRLAGVIDFGGAHLGTRSFDLISARTYRQPLVGQGYVAESTRLGWPLSDTERAAIVPIYRGFRLFMIAWHLDLGVRTERFDDAAIAAQLERTAVDREGRAGLPREHLRLPAC